MRRRTVIAALGGTAAAWPLAGRAQQKVMPVIGLLGAGFAEDPAIALNLASFRQGLKQEGFVEGENVAVEYRWARNRLERLPALAAELVALKVDVIVTEGSTLTALPAKRATSTIPIVFHAGDAVADGVVANLARPGGNLTGVSLYTAETLSKSFQLLAELVPTAKTIALLAIPNSPAAERAMRKIQEAGGASGVQLRYLAAASDSEIEAAYVTLDRLKAAAIVLANAFYVEMLVGLAARHAVPAAYLQRAYVVAGGLLSYGASIPAAYVIKGLYAGKILKGAKAGDLPVQQPSKFELVINLKTAKALGLTVPPILLARADEVIE